MYEEDAQARNDALAVHPTLKLTQLLCSFRNFYLVLQKFLLMVNGPKRPQLQAHHFRKTCGGKRKKINKGTSECADPSKTVVLLVYTTFLLVQVISGIRLLDFPGISTCLPSQAAW